MQKKLIAIYKKRQKAHDMLLECDVELDKILKHYERLQTNSNPRG